MKKLVSMMIVACMLATLCAVGVSAAEPTILWDFGEDEAMNDVMSGAGSVQYYGEKDADGNDFYTFIATGNDPYVSVNMSADDVSQVLWAKIRVKNPGPATSVELFGATSGRSLSGPECTHFDIDASNEWKTYIIYNPDANVATANAYKGQSLTETYWAGTVEFIRLDPMWQEGDDGSDSGGSMNVGDEIYIDYVAFFPTEADAKAFRSDLDGGAAATPAAADPAPAVVEETPAPAADPAPAEAPAETAPAAAPAPAAVTTAPATSDAAVIIVMMIVAALGTAVIVSRKQRV